MKRIKLLIITSLICVFANAQTLQQGRDYFQKGNYEKAKPIMLKYLKQKPSDASRNYWDGICCMETGEKDKAVPYLELAASKKIFKANRALGEYYMEKEDYQPAISNFEEYVKGISADKELHDVATEERFTFMADSLKALFRMIRNTSRVCFIDSFRVSKNELLSTYILGPSTGSFYPSSDFFDDDSEGEVYLPEMEQSVLYSRPDAMGQFRLYSKFKSFDRWADETPLLGVSRYNSATSRYLKPENIGMPFNSEANDYLYVVDEANNLGWFATDRRQPEDTVCVYVFIPSEGNPRYNYEGGDTLAIHRAARLVSITESQYDLDEVRAARQRLTLLRYELTEQAQKGSFTYVIDDLTTYHEISDFKSSDAAKLFQTWTDLKDSYETDLLRLERLRDEYADGSLREKERLKDQILQFEEKVLQTERQVLDMENDIRTTEIKFLNR